MSLTAKDLDTLSAPFDENTIGVKVQSFSKDKSKASLVCYVQHTDVYKRIEQVDPAWSSEITHETVVGDECYVRAKITIKGVSRENTGDGPDFKSATSDALKRAAMLFGVGRYLYDSETVWVPYDDQRDRFRAWTYSDHKKALRQGQEATPTASSTSTANQVAQKIVSKGAAPSKDESAKISPIRSRKQLASEIYKLRDQLQMNGSELAQYILDDFNCKAEELSPQQMGQLIEKLQAEVGRNGVLL